MLQAQPWRAPLPAPAGPRREGLVQVNPTESDPIQPEKKLNPPASVPVSVAIPAFGNEATLQQTLRHIFKCDPLPCEVLLHFDGGWEPALDLASDAPVPVRLFRSSKNLGPGGGRDRLIREAGSDIVASFDNDSWPMDADFFARALSLMNAFPQAVVLSAAVYLKEKPPLPCLAEVTEARFFEGSGALHRRSLYLQLPGYVPVPEAYGVEETDLALQAHATGMQVLSSPWLRVWHERPNADYLHAVLPWIKNEVLLGYLRYPRFLQPWTWWRSIRHVIRHQRRLPLSSLLLALAQSPAHSVAFDKFRHRYPASVIFRKNRRPLRRWVLEAEGGTLVRVQPAPAPRRIVYLQYTNPANYPPLEHSSHILARQGWEVLFLGLRTAQAQEFVFPPHPRIRVRSMRASSPGLRQKVHYLLFGLWCRLHVSRFKPEWIYASDPLSTFFAFRLAKGRRVLFHEHDSPTLTPGVKPDAVTRFILRQRAKLAQRAEAVVLPNERRLQAFLEQTKTQAQSFCVWNCPALDEVPAPLPGPRQATSEPLRVLYHGTINPARFPLSMLQALKFCGPGVIMRLVGYETDGAIGYTRKLRAEATRLGIADQFETLGLLQQRSELMARCAECHVGLSLLHISPQDINRMHMAGASNKPFDYLSQGLALVVPADPDWEALFVVEGCAKPCPIDDGEALARVLAWFRDHREETAAMGMRGQELIRSRWNYEHQFQPVLELIETPPAHSARPA